MIDDKNGQNPFNYRSRHQRCPVKKAILKNFITFRRRHLFRSFFLIKLHDFRPATLLKRDSNADFSL